MTTIVWGHGTRSRGDEKTFVPDGTTVKWFADLDENLLTRNGFMALSSGDFGTPNDSQGPGSGVTVPIFNYEVSEDLVKRDKVAILHRGDSDLQFVGAEVKEGPLCSSPGACRTAGEHKCDGLLGTVDDTEIVILVCRGLPGGDTDTQRFGGDDDSATSDVGADFNEWFDRWIAQVQADPDAAMAEFEEFSTPVKIQVGTFMAVPAWQAVHWAASYARAGDIPALFTQFRDESANAAVQWFLQNIASYGTTFADAAAADPTAFFAALDAAPAAVKDGIGAIPAVAAVRNEVGAQATAQSDFEASTADSWVPSESDLAYVATVNKEAIKNTEKNAYVGYSVAGFVLLIGDGHESQYYDWLYAQPDVSQGQITVKRPRMGAGTLEVEGCPPVKQSIVEAALNSFSDKDVEFV